MGRLHRWSARVVAVALVAMGLPAVSAGVATAHGAHSVHVQPKGDGGWKPTDAPKPSPFSWKPPAGRGVHLVKTDPHAHRVGELTGRRTADASYYRLSDGRVQEVISPVPVHYKDAHGVWKPISTAVVPVAHHGFELAARSNSFRSYFSSHASSLVRVEQGTDFVQVGVDGARAGAPKVSGDTVTYPGALGGADLSYRVGPGGVAERITLSKAPAPGTAYSFTLKAGGFVPKQRADGSIAFYDRESARAAFVIPAPYMSDARPDADSPYGVAYSTRVSQRMVWDAKAGVVRLTVRPDTAWLESSARRYPVVIDPTIDVSPAPADAANVMISSDGPTDNYDTSWRLSVGTTTTGVSRTLIKFPMPSIPAGTTISSASLRMYYDQTFTTGSTSVALEAHAATAAWDPTTATWNKSSGITGALAGSTTKQANVMDVWNTFPVTSTVQSWINGTTPNYGFVLKAASESTLGQGGPRYEGSLYSYKGETNNYPQLVITYGVPGVTVNAPTVIHSTGAELSWPAYTNSTGDSGNDLAEYQVHRSIYQSFTPSASTEIAPIKPGTTAFTDSTAVPTPADSPDPYGNAYYYMVSVKTKSGALIPGPTQLVRLPKAGRTTVLVRQGAATTLSSTQPNTVLNTLTDGAAQQWVEVGDNSSTYGTARSVFDFGALPASIPSNATVMDAYLKLWQEQTTIGTSGAVYELHALTRSFTRSQATWSHATSSTAWTTPGGDANPAADGTVSGLTNDPNRENFDATSIVQGWVTTPSSNHGLLVKLAGESPSAPQERTVFAGTNTAEPLLSPTLVVTYLDNSTGSTYYAPSTPNGMVPGTTYSAPVTINNTTTSTWSATSEVLTYHWLLPDGTDVTTMGAGGNQLQTALPADLPPAGTVTLNAQVTPPAVTDGNQDEGATLAWDMYDKSTGTYLSAGSGSSGAALPMHTAAVRATMTTTGIGSLKQQVSVDPTGNNQLGLEKFYPYTTTSTGSGSNLYSNTASGNTVWNDDLFSNPSVGFDTTLRLSYNSMSTMDTTTGFGWTIEASAPIRLGQALQFHPAGNPTSMVMVDGTGNAHQWALTTDASGNITGTPPAGVHLFLQGKACKPQDTNARAFKMIRPDRTTYYFDCEGYPTAQIDPNGNEADFSYIDRQSQNAPKEFLDHITDPMGRDTLQFTYYNKGDSYSYVDSTGALVAGTGLTDPAIIDHVRSITDVSGRTVDFYYTSQGLLGQVVDGAGTGTGNNAPKTFKFTYEATQGMKNVKLVAVQDPRLNTTNVAYYPTSSPTKWWTQTVTDRLGHATGFAYAQPGTTVTTETTVTDVFGGHWVYDTDSAGRLTKQTDPAIQATPAGATAPTTVTPTTTIGWDGDNNVNDLKENNGAETKWSYDPGTGLPVDSWDPLAVKNGTASTHYTLATTDSADTTLSGHIGFVDDITTPLGYRTQYNYYGLSSTDPNYVSTPGYAGNLYTVQAPDGTATGAPANSYLTTYTYTPVGDVASVKDADGNTTTYSYTKYIGPGTEQVYEPTGQPLTVTDAMTPAGIYSYVYDAAGDLTSTTDPLDHTSTTNYDIYGRPQDTQVPKDQASGSYVVTPAPVYDGNDNVLQQTAPYISGFPVANSTTVAVYDKNDQPQTVTLPANTTATSPAARTVTYGYDYVNHKSTITQPLGNVAGATAATTADYTTTTDYNAVDQVTESDHLAPDGTTVWKSQYGYDDVGNKITVTDPLGNKSTTHYDADHRVSGTLDAGGGTTAIGYDLDGRKTSATDQNGHQTTYVFDPDNQVTEVDVPRAVNTGTTPPTVTAWDISKYTYDQVGNQTAVISPKGVAAGSTGPGGAFTTSAHYDADNRADKVYGAFDPSDPLYKSDQQPETDYHRDVAGRVTSVDLLRKANTFISSSPTSAETATTSYTYWDNGWTHTSTDPYNIKTSYDYNGSGQQNDRLLTASDGTEPTTDTSAGSGTTRDMHWLYNPDGSLNQSSDTGLPNGWQDQVLPADANGSSGWLAGPAGQGYDGATYYQSGAGTFQWNMAVPATGHYKVYVWYSTAGTNNAQYSYFDNNGANQPLGTIDQTKNVGSWQVLNGGTTINLAAGTKQVLQLNAGNAGNVADAIKIVCTDCAGTDTGTTQTNAFTYSYDADGNLSDLADQSPNAQFDDYMPTFDNLDRLTQLVEKKSNAAVHTLKYGYDAASNLTSQSQDTAANGNISAGTFVYNALNQLKQVTDTQNGGAGVVTNYTYYPNGQLHTEQKGNLNLVTDTYNPDDTLAGSTEATGTGTVVDQHAYGYDANNNIASDNATIQNANGGAALTQNSTLTYSPNNQVVSVTNGQDDQRYVYDSAGNVQQDAVKDPTSGTTATTDFAYQRDRLYSSKADGSATGGTYQYDTVGRLGEVVGGVWLSVGTVDQQFQYDGFDNITSQSSTGPSGHQDTTTSTYDSLNRLISQTIAQANTSTSESENVDYLGLSGTVADEQITPSGGATDSKVYDYSGNGERLALLDTLQGSTGGTDTAYYTYNQHGDVEALTSTAGATAGTYGYTAYGVDDKSLDSGDDSNNLEATFPFNPYRFNSARVSSATGTLNMGARTYDPSINRFVSRDTYNASGADAGLSGATRYGFAGGNPISNIEADGHSFWSVAGGIAAGAAVIGGCAIGGALTAGVAGLACAVGAGLVGAVAAQGISCGQQGGSACSPSSFGVSAAEGAVGGAVAFGVAAVLPEALAGWATGAIAGAASGAAGYGTGCALGAACSATGLAEATALGGVLGGAFGGGFGAIQKVRAQSIPPGQAAEWRANEIQKAHLNRPGKKPDEIAYKQRMVAVVDTDGPSVVGGGVRDLSPQQQGMITHGELAAKLPGEHGEVTSVTGAIRAGEIPREIGVSREFCDLCELFIQETGGVIDTPTTAHWPEFGSDPVDPRYFED